jgi:hypothetical protein
MNVLVSGQGSGSGGAGTICVRGVVTDQDTGGGLPTIIRVVVVTGWVAPPPPEPDSGGVDVTPTGQDWCAQGVLVPGSSSAGVQATAIAWLKTGSSGWSNPYTVWFNAGGSYPVDCCTGGGSERVDSAASASAFQSWPPPPPPFPPNLPAGRK